MKPEQFPKLSEVQKAIERLNNKQFPSFKSDSCVESFVKDIVSSISDEFGFILNAVKPMKCNGSFFDFYRVRPVDTFSDINMIREHSYPPIDIVGMGRCNFPKYPVFYCSNSIGVSLMEVVRGENVTNQKYCVSKWELIPSKDDLMFESFLNIPLPKENLFDRLNDGFSEKIAEVFGKDLGQKLDLEQKEGLLEYFKYLDSCFINDANYSLSASLAHRSLYADHNYRTDILMYPSVQSLFRGVNLAMHPNFVENNLKLTRLYILGFEEYDVKKGLMNVTISRYAEIDKNVLMWRNIDPNDEIYMQKLKDDFGEMLNSEFRKK